MKEPQSGLDDLYRRIPAVPCRGLCIDSCGPISMSVDERSRLQAAGADIPPLLDAIEAIRRGDDYYCPALVDGGCSVYDIRPTICRLWGATESMPCPYGCTPEGALTQEESHELLRASARVGGGMADDFGAD